MAFSGDPPEIFDVAWGCQTDVLGLLAGNYPRQFDFEIASYVYKTKTRIGRQLPGLSFRVGQQVQAVD
jgi:hypothetical protein